MTTADVITDFAIPTSGDSPSSITTGPDADGNLWFTEVSGNKIGRVTTSPTAGVITEFAIGGNPNSITAGPDGNLWLADASNNMIRRIVPPYPK
jgi:streptogramin lyase